MFFFNFNFALHQVIPLRCPQDVSNGSALPSQVVRTAAVQTLVSLAAMAGPSVAIADDLAVPQSIPQPMTQMATPTQATGRVTYSRFLEFVEEKGTYEAT